MYLQYTGSLNEIIMKKKSRKKFQVGHCQGQRHDHFPTSTEIVADPVFEKSYIPFFYLRKSQNSIPTGNSNQ